MESIEYLSKFKGAPHLAINTIIMNYNISNILDLTQWAIDKDRISSISFQAIMQPFHDPILEDWHRIEEYSMLWPSDIKNLQFAIDGIIKIKKDHINKNRQDKVSNPVSQLEAFKNYFLEPGEFLKQIKCKVLDSGFFAISPNGDVNLCPFMEPIGNIKDGGLEKLWYSDKAEEIKNKMLLCKKGCHHLVNCWYEEDGHEQ
jgi:radical SAM protein with 4Fe4S-binding SPASM domain